MNLRHLIAVGALALSAMTAGAQAGPMQTLTPAGAVGIVETAASGCWRQHGVRHCNWYGTRGRVYGYRSRYREYNNPDAYRAGSSRWWQEMDRQDRGGRGGRG